MRLELDNSIAVADAQAKLLKWELVLNVGGIDYRIKPLNNSETAQLAEIAAIGGDSKAQQFLATLIESATDATGTPVEGQPLPTAPEQIAAMLLAITFYLKEQIKKKSQTLAQTIEREVRI